MQIIKPGKKISTIRRFECTNCGCVFEADESEYKIVFNYNESHARCKCPCCNKWANEVRMRGEGRCLKN